jgi:hypothetical protein
MHLNDPIAIVGYVLLTGFWIVVSALAWFFVRSVRSRRYAHGSLWCLSIASLLFAGLFVGATPGSASLYRHYFLTRELFGRKFYLPSPRLSYSDTGLIEIYSIEVFDISETLARWASAPPPEFATDYPEAKSGPYWKRVTWHRTPADSEYHQLLGGIDGGYDDGSPGWEQAAKAEELRRQLMNEPGNYFAFRYWDEGSDPMRVQFYILAPQTPAHHRILAVTTRMLAAFRPRR